MPLANYALVLAGILFCMGVLGVVLRRNLLVVFMSLEIMLNSAGLAFIAGAAQHGRAEGQFMFMFILPVAAAEVSIGLALAVLLFQHYRTLDLAALARMKENA